MNRNGKKIGMNTRAFAQRKCGGGPQYLYEDQLFYNRKILRKNNIRRKKLVKGKIQICVNIKKLREYLGIKGN